MHDEPLRRRRPLPLSLLLILVFGLGVLLERSGWMPGAFYHEPANVVQTFEPFWQSWRLVQEYYVDRSAVNSKRMTDGAIEGMLASLGDYGHTSYLTAAEFQRLQGALKGNMEGIGARITFRQRRPTIFQTMPHSPARTAGLRPGDVLLEVDGKPVSDVSLERIVELVRGKAGTVVTLRILRQGSTQPMDVRITRARVDIPSVDWRMLPGLPLAHIAVMEFGDQANAQLRAALAGAKKANARGLVLDVRGNAGGLKDQAVQVTSEFIAKGTVFIEKDAKGDVKEVPVSGKGSAFDIPVCLLVDEGTASAAEIFAGAVQDHHRGPLIGTRTFGTGTVLEPFRLDDGSALLLAVAEWLTPDGRQIWKKGIEPDIVVHMPETANIEWPGSENPPNAEQLAHSSDLQLRKAIELMKKALGLP